MKTYSEFFAAQKVLGDLLHEDMDATKHEWVSDSARAVLVELETAFRMGKLEAPAYMTLKFRQDELIAKIDYIKKLINLRKGYDYENTKLGADLFSGSVIIS